jgi:hypothetical protein
MSPAGATARECFVLPSLFQANGFEAFARIEREHEVAAPRHMRTGDMGPDQAEHRSQGRVLVGNEAVRQAQCVDEDEWFPEQANNHTVVSRRLARLQLKREALIEPQPPDAKSVIGQSLR